jgi:hypothetical protein
MASSGKAAERRPDGMPVGTPFSKGKSGNPAGLPKGYVSLATRIQRILEGDEQLPDIIAATIAKAVGGDKKPIDAVIIVALLQALQGDKQWADWLSVNGYVKPKEVVEVIGDPNAPVTFTLKIDNS